MLYMCTYKHTKTRTVAAGSPTEMTRTSGPWRSTELYLSVSQARGG